MWTALRSTPHRKEWRMALKPSEPCTPACSVFQIPRLHVKIERRGVAQPGRAPGSGPGGRRFKSSLPDHQVSLNQLISGLQVPG